jgi:hypothetical protein
MPDRVNQVLVSLLRIDHADGPHQQIGVRDTEAAAGLGPATLARPESLGIDRRVDDEEPVPDPIGPRVGPNQGLAPDRHRVCEADDHRHHRSAYGARGACVEKLPDHPDRGLEPGRDRALRMGAPVHLHDVSALVADQPPDAADVGADAADELPLRSQVRRRAKPAERRRVRLNAARPQPLDRLIGPRG